MDADRLVDDVVLLAYVLKWTRNGFRPRSPM